MVTVNLNLKMINTFINQDTILALKHNQILNRKGNNSAKIQIEKLKKSIK